MERRRIARCIYATIFYTVLYVYIKSQVTRRNKGKQN